MKTSGPAGTDKKPSVFRRLKKRLTADEMFHETELQANKLGALILLCSVILLALILLLTAVGFFPLSVDDAAIPAIVEIVLLLGVCGLVKFDAWWLKPLLLFGMVIVYARLDSMLTHKAAILMVIPVMFSSRYFSQRLTIFTSLLSTVAFACSAYWGATHGLPNLNIVTLPEGTVMIATGGFLGDAVKNAGAGDEMFIVNTMIYDYIPRWLMFSLASIISCNVAQRGRDMVVTQHDKDVKSARIESELNLATKIQAAMLPRIFPPFPERTEFDLYASMDPAKEVGGDFYDFFLVDDDHLCMVMADVSGKGVPAALFMMASKIVLANNAKMGKSPARILTDVNDATCANNPEEMFVTVWLGILEISTGKLTAASAGHEYPVIKNADGAFEVFKDRHGFVIGGMAGMPYKEYELNLQPGAKLFLYTDGVPEATDGAGQMFGMERTLAVLNAEPDAAPEKALKNVRAAVDDFVKDAEQFDDLTMLCMEYRGSSAEQDELDVEAAVENLPRVQAFVNARLGDGICTEKARTQIEISVEEIFVNIAHYAYAPETGRATVRVRVTDKEVSVTFIDRGAPFDPLAKEDPDVTAASQERKIGGLGIFMTKKAMDDIAYEYKDGQNILTLTKKL